jgi:hypothetical protein
MRSAVVAFEMPNAGDGTFADGNRLVAPGGVALADWLRDHFAKEFTLLSETEDHEDYGWTFQFMDGDERVWCLLSMGPEEPNTVYFWSEVQPPLIKRLFGKKERTHLRAQEIAERSLRADSRFENVRSKKPGTPDNA